MKHLLIFRLWLKIFTQERAPWQTLTYWKSTIETINSKDTRTTLYCIYCKFYCKLLWKNNCSQVFFQIYYAFAEQELYQNYIIVTNYNTSLVSGMCILNEGIYYSHSFFYCSVIISQEHLKRSICQGRTPCLFHNTCRNHSYYIKRY